MGSKVAGICSSVFCRDMSQGYVAWKPVYFRGGNMLVPDICCSDMSQNYLKGCVPRICPRDMLHGIGYQYIPGICWS